MGRKHKKKKWWFKDNYNWKPRPKVYIEPQAYEKLSSYIQFADGEISGFGKIRIEKETKNKWLQDKKVVVEDVKIFEQQCSSGGTRISEEALAKFITKLIRQKQDPHNWRLWWHSHFDFGVSWSGVDEEAIRILTQEQNSELYSICMNQAYDIIARKDINGKREDASVRILPRVNTKILKGCDNDIKKMVDFAIRYRIKDDWLDKIDVDKAKSKIIIPQKRLFLPDYSKKYNTKVPLLSTRDAADMGLYFDPYVGVYVRIRDDKEFTIEEVANGLHKAA